MRMILVACCIGYSPYARNNFWTLQIIHIAVTAEFPVIPTNYDNRTQRAFFPSCAGASTFSTQSGKAHAAETLMPADSSFVTAGPSALA